MKEEENITTGSLCASMLLLAPTRFGFEEPGLSGQDLLNGPVCAASVNHDNFWLFIMDSYLLEKMVKTDPNPLFFIQGRYNN